MEKQTYNEQTIIQYLLGSLPEKETERFDELSFIDDEFAEQVQAAEDDLADAYVNGELSGQTLERFNSYYLASPKRRDNVRFAQSLQVFTDQAVAAKPAEEAGESIANRFELNRPGAWRRFLPGFFAVPSLATQWSFAGAAILLLLGGAWLAFGTFRLQSRMDQVQAESTALKQRETELQTQLGQERSAGSETARELARVREQLAQLEQQVIAQQRAQQQPSLPAELNIARFDLAPQMRSGSATIAIPPETDYVTLQLELDADDYPAYRAELRTQTGDEKVWSSGRLKAKVKSEKRVLDVGIRADKLKTRAYILTLKGVADDGSEKDAPGYAFRVVKQ